MGVELIQYLTEFLPVAVGLAFFLAAKSLNFYKARVKVNTIYNLGELELEESKIGIGRCSRNFDEFLVDELIINGCRRTSGSTKPSAGADLGIMELNGLDDLTHVRINSDRLVLFSDVSYNFVDKILTFESICGLILAYIAANKLEMVN